MNRPNVHKHTGLLRFFEPSNRIQLDIFELHVFILSLDEERNH